MRLFPVFLDTSRATRVLPFGLPMALLAGLTNLAQRLRRGARTVLVLCHPLTLLLRGRLAGFYGGQVLLRNRWQGSGLGAGSVCLKANSSAEAYGVGALAGGCRPFGLPNHLLFLSIPSIYKARNEDREGGGS